MGCTLGCEGLGSARRLVSHILNPSHPLPQQMLERVGLLISRAFLMAEMVKDLPAVRETQVQFLYQQVPLENRMATHSSILAWRISWTEEPGGLQSMGVTRVRYN